MSEADETVKLIEMVEELCDLDEGLTGWEITFIDDMSKRNWFTDDQADKIRQVYKERL